VASSAGRCAGLGRAVRGLLTVPCRRAGLSRRARRRGRRVRARARAAALPSAGPGRVRAAGPGRAVPPRRAGPCGAGLSRRARRRGRRVRARAAVRPLGLAASGRAADRAVPPRRGWAVSAGAASWPSSASSCAGPSTSSCARPSTSASSCARPSTSASSCAGPSTSASSCAGPDTSASAGRCAAVRWAASGVGARPGRAVPCRVRAAGGWGWAVSAGAAPWPPSRSASAGRCVRQAARRTPGAARQPFPGKDSPAL
jgi:hypothetical protein